MELTTLQTWLQSKQSRPFGALPEHTSIFHSLLTSKTTPSDSSQELISHIASTPASSDSAWRFRQLLFATAAELPTHHAILLELVKEIQKLPPRPEKANRLDSGLWSEWRDFHGYIHTRKLYTAQNPRDDLRGSSGSSEGGEEHGHIRAVNFTAFSAKLIDSGVCKPADLGIFAFFDLRDALEYSDAWFEKQITGKEGAVTARQLKAVDVAIAAQWVNYGGEKVLKLRNEEFEDVWENALKSETDLWRGKSAGFSKERWELWRSGFEDFLERAKRDDADHLEKWSSCAAEKAVEAIGAMKA